MVYMVRRNPVHNGSVLNELDRVWDSLVSDRGTYPAVDIIENEHGYEIEADLPGISENDVEAKVEDRVLIIQSTEKKQENEADSARYLIRERRSRAFSRSFVVPKDADVTAIEASFKNGVLRLFLPKLPEAKPRSIEIRRG
jgi:HSP20 family protein